MFPKLAAIRVSGCHLIQVIWRSSVSWGTSSAGWLCPTALGPLATWSSAAGARLADTGRVSLRRVDLRLLRYFVAVAEERHFGRAAARLHMSQPPLSRAIRQLEADLGTVLLHRSATGVTLTAAGKLLYDEARARLEQ